MFKNCFRLSVILTGIGMGSLADGAIHVDPVQGSLVEKSDDKTRLSGEMVLAVMRGQSRFLTEGAQIHTVLPPIDRQGATIVVTICTADGLYQGSANYHVPGDANDREVLLGFPTKNPALLQKYGPGLVLCYAVLYNGSETVSYVLPCSWSEQAADAPVSVYLNSSAAADGSSLRVDTRAAGAGTATKAECAKVTTSPLYDRVLALAQTDASQVEVHVSRYSSGRFRNEVNFTVVMR